MNKLQEVLNDKESMKQITELAEMLTGNSGENSQPPAETDSGKTSGTPDFSALFNALEGNSQNSSAPASQATQATQENNQNLSPTQPGQSKEENSNSFGLDMNSLIKLQKIMSQANKPDKNVAFLLALKPLLKEENQGKIDRIIKIFRLMSLYPLIKESGLLGGDLFGLLG